MYKIVFHFRQGSPEVYSGGTFTFAGEKYAAFGTVPKLYKSEKVARRSAEKLSNSCVNCVEDVDRYEIVEVKT